MHQSISKGLSSPEQSDTSAIESINHIAIISINQSMNRYRTSAIESIKYIAVTFTPWGRWPNRLSNLNRMTITAGKMAPHHMDTPNGMLMAEEAGKALMLLLLLLMDILLLRDPSPPATGPSAKAKPQAGGKASKLSKHRLANPGLTSDEYRALVNGTCADAMQTTTDNVKKLLGMGCQPSACVK